MLHKCNESTIIRYQSDPSPFKANLIKTHKLSVDGSSYVFLIHAIYYGDASYFLVSSDENYYYIVLNKMGQIQKSLKLNPLNWNLHNSIFYPSESSLYLVLNIASKGLVFVPIEKDTKDLILESAIQFPNFQGHILQNQLRDNALYISGYSFIAKFREHNKAIVADYYATLSKLPVTTEFIATSVDVHDNTYFIAHFAATFDQVKKIPYFHGHWFGMIDNNQELRFVRKITPSIPPLSRIAIVNDTICLYGGKRILALSNEGETRNTLTLPNHLSFDNFNKLPIPTIDKSVYLGIYNKKEKNKNYWNLKIRFDGNVIINPTQFTLRELSSYASSLSYEGELLYCYGTSNFDYIDINILKITESKKSNDSYKIIDSLLRNRNIFKGILQRNQIGENDLDILKLSIISENNFQSSYLQEELFKVSDATGKIIVHTQ